MRQFAANVSILFPRLPYLERFRAAFDAGFDSVESSWPVDALAEGMTLDDLVHEVESYPLQLVLLNFAAGDTKAGDRGLAGDPITTRAFRSNVPVAIDLALRLGCRKLNALAGNALSPEDRPRQLRLLADNVAFAAGSAEKAGITVLLEPLNPIDAPRYLLSTTDCALEVIERVGRPNVRLQLDVYHLAMSGEDPIETIGRVGPRIGHVQLADVPGRHEPGSGCLPYPAILDALESVGYRETFGLEFVPLDPAAPDFSCVERLGGVLRPSGRQRRTD
jgi:hydroxypyruvate isomerase